MDKDNITLETEGMESAEDGFLSLLQDDDSEHVDDFEEVAEDFDGELGEESEESEPEETEPEETEEQEEEELFTVKIDGVEKQVTKSELLAGYQKTASSTERFTQAQKLQSQAQQAMQQAMAEREQAINVLQQYETRLEAFIAQAPDPSLIDSNPGEYLRQQAAYQNLQQQYQQAQQQRMQLMQAQEQDLYQQQAAVLEEESQKLVESIPTWADEKAAAKEKSEIKDYLKGLGYTDDALARVQDHREVLLVRKAMLYDRLTEQGRTGKAKAQNKPPRVERPGARRANQRGAKAYDSLKRTGSVNAAAAVFADMIQD